MPNRIRERICRICEKHTRPIQILEGWLLLAMVVGGSFATGHFAGLSRADVQIAEQSRAHQAEQQRLMDINRQLMLIIEQRLPAIAGTAGDAAQMAKEAASTAHTAAQAAAGAGAAAKAASSKAQRAATTVREAASSLTDALEPQLSQSPPRWLDGP